MHILYKSTSFWIVQKDSSIYILRPSGQPPPPPWNSHISITCVRSSPKVKVIHLFYQGHLSERWPSPWGTKETLGDHWSAPPPDRPSATPPPTLTTRRFRVSDTCTGRHTCTRCWPDDLGYEGGRIMITMDLGYMGSEGKYTLVWLVRLFYRKLLILYYKFLLKLFQYPSMCFNIIYSQNKYCITEIIKNKPYMDLNTRQITTSIGPLFLSPLSPF